MPWLRYTRQVNQGTTASVMGSNVVQLGSTLGATSAAKQLIPLSPKRYLATGNNRGAVYDVTYRRDIPQCRTGLPEDLMTY
jgi:hypothetical protein